MQKGSKHMFYEMTIAGLKRQLPLCKVADDLYIGAFIMFSDVEITKACATELLKKAPEFDIMITAESKGIPLLYEMGRIYVLCVAGHKTKTSKPCPVDSFSTTDWTDWMDLNPLNLLNLLNLYLGHKTKT